MDEGKIEVSMYQKLCICISWGLKGLGLMALALAVRVYLYGIPPALQNLDMAQMAEAIAQVQDTTAVLAIKVEGLQTKVVRR